MQNARDVSVDNKTIKMQFTFDNDKVIFRHSGRPFYMKDLMYLIGQQTTKQWNENLEVKEEPTTIG